MSVRGQLWRNNRAYRFAKTNLWCTALGRRPKGGNSTREWIGCTRRGCHVRIMAASEGRPDATVPRPCEKWCNPITAAQLG